MLTQGAGVMFINSKLLTPHHRPAKPSWWYLISVNNSQSNDSISRGGSFTFMLYHGLQACLACNKCPRRNSICNTATL
jgi:hypothetical protein